MARGTGSLLPLARVGLVAIGRNEGERLRRCLDSLPTAMHRVVYVDSASADGSTEMARRRSVEVVDLDLSVPFTAARARNAGLGRLLALWPDTELVQFVDGDCSIAPLWIERALEAMVHSPRVAVVCGRRREARPSASVYNRLCDIEWDTPVGDVQSCGGDAMIRVEAIREVGGYEERLIAGEEPEMCFRLRARGWVVRRIDHEMTLHDAAMTRFGQWWRRSVRAGHAFAEVHGRHPDLWGKEVRSCIFWGFVLPAATLLAAAITHGIGLALLLAYPALWIRIAAGWRASHHDPSGAGLYATYCVVGKFPEALGVGRYLWSRASGKASRLIEYK
jgi:GT2 family glycosyltransferase